MNYSHSLLQAACPTPPLPETDLDNLDEALRQEHVRAGRYGNVFCLVLTKISGFRELALIHGRRAAGLYSTEVGDLIRKNIRTCDRVFRYSDSEYMIILPHTSHQGATRFTWKLKRMIEHHRVVAGTGLLVSSADFAITMFPSEMLPTGALVVD